MLYYFVKKCIKCQICGSLVKYIRGMHHAYTFRWIAHDTCNIKFARIAKDNRHLYILQRAISLFTRSCALLQNNVLKRGTLLFCSGHRNQIFSSNSISFARLRRLKPTVVILSRCRSTISTAATGEIMFLTLCNDNPDKCGGDDHVCMQNVPST